MHRRPFLTIAAYTYLFTMLALLFMPLMARAQNPALSSTPPAGKVLVNVFETTSGQNVYTYAAGTANTANAAGLDWKMWNDALAVDSHSTLDVGGGVKAPIGTRAVPTKPNVAKAVGNFARGVGGAALKTAGAVYAAADVAKALWDLCNELGYNCSKGSDGQPLVTKPNPESCALGVYCAQYRAGLANAFGPWSYSFASACSSGAAAVAAAYPNDVSGFYGTTYGGNSGCFVTKPSGSIDVLSVENQTVLGTGAVIDPSSIAELEAAIAAKSGWPSTTALPKVVEQSVASGNPVPLPAPSQVVGPSIIPMVPTITEFPDGSKTTVTPEKRLTFGQTSPTVTVTDGQTTTTTSPTGVTSTVSSGSAPSTLPQPLDVKIETCGLPGKPACKIDETGTPSPVAGTQYDAAIDSYKQSVDDKRAVIGGTGDKSFFGGWSMFFFAPPVVQCQPLAMPTYLGVQIDSLDPCPVADGMRTVMGYIWALAALYLCLRMIREVA